MLLCFETTHSSYICTEVGSVETLTPG